jgi:hypothetical protein
MGGAIKGSLYYGPVKQGLLGLVAIVYSATASFAQPIRCDITTKFACSSTGGCQANTLGVFNRIDLDRCKFSRCDSRGCDDYDAVIQRSGEFILIDVPGRGIFAKLSTDGSEFVEVTSLGTSILASFGSCRQEQ